MKIFIAFDWMVSVYLYKNLLFLRKKKGWTQSEMHDRCGVSRMNWSHYENGNTEPDLQTLARISLAFEVTLDELVLKNLSSDGNNGNLNAQHGDEKKPENGKVNSNLKGNLNDQNKLYSTAEDQPEPTINEPDAVSTWAVLGAIKGVDEKLDGLRLLVEKALKK